MAKGRPASEVPTPACEHGIVPWTECERCVRTARPSFRLLGGGWTESEYVDNDSLPPLNEVNARRREQGCDTIHEGHER